MSPPCRSPIDDIHTAPLLPQTVAGLTPHLSTDTPQLHLWASSELELHVFSHFTTLPPPSKWFSSLVPPRGMWLAVDNGDSGQISSQRRRILRKSPQQRWWEDVFKMPHHLSQSHRKPLTDLKQNIEREIEGWGVGFLTKVVGEQGIRGSRRKGPKSCWNFTVVISKSILWYQNKVMRGANQTKQGPIVSKWWFVEPAWRWLGPWETNWDTFTTLCCNVVSSLAW